MYAEKDLVCDANTPGVVAPVAVADPVIASCAITAKVAKPANFKRAPMINPEQH